MPTILIQMSKRCAVGYAACEACAQKHLDQGRFSLLPDEALTLETVKRMKVARKWPPKCAFCGGLYPYRIELTPDQPAEQQIAAVQETLL